MNIKAIIILGWRVYKRLAMLKNPAERKTATERLVSALKDGNISEKEWVGLGRFLGIVQD